VGIVEAQSVALDGSDRRLPFAHRKNVKKLEEAKQRTEKVMRYLEQNLESYGQNRKSKLRKQYIKMQGCGNRLKFHYYYNKEETRLVDAIFCQNKWLDLLCGLRWATRTMHRYKEKAEEIDEQFPGYKKVHITLTIVNDTDLTKAYNKLDNSMKKMSTTIRNARKRRTSSEFGKIDGMVGTIEIKKGRGGKWHPHFHGLAYVKDYISQDRLSAEWEKMTGDSYITWVSEVNGDIKDFCEVFSYTLKASTMSVADQIHVWFICGGKSMVRSWGLFRNVKMPEKLTDDPLEDEPYLELIYDYLQDRRGYAISHVSFQCFFNYGSSNTYQSKIQVSDPEGYKQFIRAMCGLSEMKTTYRQRRLGDLEHGKQGQTGEVQGKSTSSVSR
jgi:hypothetical protein